MRTVFNEQLEQIREQGSLFQLSNMLRFLSASFGFWRVEIKLKLLELWLNAKRMVGWNGSALVGM